MSPGRGGERDRLAGLRRIERAFETSLEESGLLDGVQRLLAAVSGGADSTALLLFLAGLRARRGPGRFPELLVGHVHHGLRGAEADRDEAFVRDLGRSRGLEVLVHRGDARAEAARRGLSPEAAARALRYDAFRLWAAERRLDAVALAHQLDDQAETVLLRAARGTGIRGLAGIPFERRLLRGQSRTRIIRPLLLWTRKQILEFLALAGQEYRADATNDDLSIPRNRVRHEILPALEEHVHPAARASLGLLGFTAAGWIRDLEALGRRCFLEALAREPGPGVSLDIETLRAWPPSVLGEAFRIAAARAVAGAWAEGGGMPEPRLPRTALEVLLDWVAEDPEGVRHSLGGRALEGKRLVLEARYGLIRMRIAAGRDAAPAVPPPADLAPGGKASWGGWTFEAAGAPGAGAGSREDPRGLVERFDAARLIEAGPLRVRARREGDRFHPLGAPGSKPLKEFFRQRQVWPSERDEVPLLAAGDAIAWVVGHRIAEPFRVRPGSRPVLVIEALPPGGG